MNRILWIYFPATSHKSAFNYSSMGRVTLLILFSLLLSSCKNNSLTNIVGTWKLDSTIHNNHRKMPTYEHIEIIFSENGGFEYDYREGDVINNYKGKFYLKDSSNFKAIQLITDTLSYGMKSFQKRFNYALVGINKNHLITSSEEAYSLPNDSIVRHKRIDFFKKIE